MKLRGGVQKRTLTKKRLSFSLDLTSPTQSFRKNQTMISNRNMERSLELLHLFKNDFQGFEKEVKKLSKKDNREISWLLEKCFENIRDKDSLEEFMN